ncbi:hypothetical protein QYM36_008351, partial [Artemia franciscana]
ISITPTTATSTAAAPINTPSPTTSSTVLIAPTTPIPTVIAPSTTHPIAATFATTTIPTPQDPQTPTIL